LFVSGSFSLRCLSGAPSDLWSKQEQKITVISKHSKQETIEKQKKHFQCEIFSGAPKRQPNKGIEVAVKRRVVPQV
jgi:hypothetical protein